MGHPEPGESLEALMAREVLRGNRRRLIEALLTGFLAIGIAEGTDLLLTAFPSTALHEALVSGRLADARTRYESAMTLQEQLVQQKEAEPSYRHELARSHYNRALVRERQTITERIHNDYQEAQGREKLLAADP